VGQSGQTSAAIAVDTRLVAAVDLICPPVAYRRLLVSGRYRLLRATSAYVTGPRYMWWVTSRVPGSGLEPSPVIDGRAEDRERFTGHATTVASWYLSITVHTDHQPGRHDRTPETRQGPRSGVRLVLPSAPTRSQMNPTTTIRRPNPR
jgi:hypothetical protein